VAVDPQTLLVAGADRVHVPDPHVKRGVVVEEVPNGVLCGILETGSLRCPFSRALSGARDEQRMRILSIGQ